MHEVMSSSWMVAVTSAIAVAAALQTNLYAVGSKPFSLHCNHFSLRKQWTSAGLIVSRDL